MIQRVPIALLIILVTAALAPMATLIPQPSLAAADVSAVVDLVLLPSSQTVDVDEVFEVAIEAQCDGQDVTGIAAFIDFDPDYLEVQSVTGGGTLTDFVVSHYDNVAGTIDYNAGTFTRPLPSGTFTVATVKFKAISSDGNISLNFSTVFPRKSDADFGGESKLRGLHGTTITIVGESAPDNEDELSEPLADNPEEPDMDSDRSPEKEEDKSPLPPSSQSDPPSNPGFQKDLLTDNDSTDWYIPASIIVGVVAAGMLVVLIGRRRSDS